MAESATVKLCECGCGEPTPIAAQTRRERGIVKGQPARFIHGHQNINLEDILQRILARCIRFNDCLVWQGALNGAGYGQMWIAGHKWLVHRAVYEYVHGSIPAQLKIDHVRARGCRSRACCNIDHLEAVTHRTNIIRGDSAIAKNAAKTHCQNGHELSPDNLRQSGVRRGQRECRICFLAYMRRWHRDNP